MILNIVLGFTYLLVSRVLSIPVAITDDGLTDFLRDGVSGESVVVKRRNYEDNPDGQLKQISLSSLVGDLENNMFASALSLNKIFTDKGVNPSEIKVSADLDHQSLTKKEENKEAASTKPTTTESSAYVSEINTGILRTTEKEPETSGVPTHVIIDRIAIEPHAGLALIPIFELNQTRKDDDAKEEHAFTKITISKTKITGLASEIQESSSTSPLLSTTSTNRNTTTDDVLKSFTTPKNIEQLKEAEEELKEKLAEIEADPIILSARV